MNPPSQSSRGQIVVALAFDSQTDALCRTAASLARRFQMDVHLTHVVEPTLSNPWIQLSAAQAAYLPIYPDIDEAERKQATSRLEELAKGLELPFRPTTAVLYGLRSQTIISEAVAKRANLLITGFDPDSYKVSLSGLSTALMLLADAPMPVLAVAKGAVPDFGKTSFKIMVADDFMENTQEAVHKAFELASGLPSQAEVRQVYVHGDFRELLRSKWEELKCRLPDKDAGNMTPDSIWASEYQALLAKGKAQGGPFRRKAELAGVKITLDVRTSTSVSDEFRQVVEEFSPDLVTFGRHRFLKTRPFLIGRMPVKTMLELRRPVLVVPPTSELYARLPFPAAT